MTFKDHFSGHAALYRQARPTYPAALFAWLASQAPSRARAWDPGCGNGQVAVALAGHFDQVVATDPSGDQIAQATPNPRVHYRVEPAEHSSLAAASVDLVTVGQALHWFEHAAFFAEVARVLRPGGVFAAWSYAGCHVAPEIDVHLEHLYCDLTGPYWMPERDMVVNGYADLDFPFEPLAAPRFEMVMQWNARQLLAYLRSWSASQKYLQANGEDPVCLIEDSVRAAWNNGRATRPVRWEFHLRVRRKPGSPL